MKKTLSLLQVDEIYAINMVNSSINSLTNYNFLWNLKWLKTEHVSQLYLTKDALFLDSA